MATEILCSLHGNKLEDSYLVLSDLCVCCFFPLDYESRGLQVKKQDTFILYLSNSSFFNLFSVVYIFIYSKYIRETEQEMVSDPTKYFWLQFSCFTAQHKAGIFKILLWETRLKDKDFLKTANITFLWKSCSSQKTFSSGKWIWQFQQKCSISSTFYHGLMMLITLWTKHFELLLYFWVLIYKLNLKGHKAAGIRTTLPQ